MSLDRVDHDCSLVWAYGGGWGRDSRMLYNGSRFTAAPSYTTKELTLWSFT